MQELLDGGPPFIREGMWKKRAILTAPHGRRAGEKASVTPPEPARLSRGARGSVDACNDPENGEK